MLKEGIYSLRYGKNQLVFTYFYSTINKEFT